MIDFIHEDGSRLTDHEQIVVQMAIAEVHPWLDGDEIEKIIYKPNQVLNIVTKKVAP